MRTLPLVLALTLTACAYPRRSTLTHPAPESAQPRTQPKDLWSLRLIDAQLPETKRGLPWDSDGTPPDPYVKVVIDGRTVWESPPQHDTLHPVWNVELPRNIYVPPGGSFRLELWDEDSASADPAGVLLSSGLPETALPGAIAHLTLDNLARIDITVSAPRAFRGVGIGFEQHSNALVVLSVEPFSPAARAGIRSGDRITAIGGKQVGDLGGPKAASELSLASDRGSVLTVAGDKGQARDVTLDHDYLWLLM